MEAQIKNHHEEDVEVALCAAIGCVDVSSLTKDENLRTILHNLLNSLKTVHGNEIYVCKGRDEIIIRGLYFTSDHVDLCENVCLHIIKSENGNIDSPFEYCQKTCEKFVIPYAQATLIENYSKLIYTLARNNVKFDARLVDTVFEIAIKA
jgi:hypothetical protein